MILKKAPVSRSLFQIQHRNRLLQRRGDGSELAVDGGAEGVNARDDCQSDAGADQSVFDRGGAGFVLYETSNKVGH